MRVTCAAMKESCSLRTANSTSVTRNGCAAAACAAATFSAFDLEAIRCQPKGLLNRASFTKRVRCKSAAVQLRRNVQQGLKLGAGRGGGGGEGEGARQRGQQTLKLWWRGRRSQTCSRPE